MKRAGRTQRMLQKVARSTAKNNVIVAHTQEFADVLQERFTDMMSFQELKGRTFLFIGASNPSEVHDVTIGKGVEIFYDHQFWEAWYSRSMLG